MQSPKFIKKQKSCLKKKTQKKKKKGENEERNLFGECLAKRGREKNNSGVHVFSLRAHKKVFSSK